MINFDDVKQENIKEHNPNWSQISDHPYKILITEVSVYGKTNSVFLIISLLICLVIKNVIKQYLNYLSEVEI